MGSLCAILVANCTEKSSRTKTSDQSHACRCKNAGDTYKDPIITVMVAGEIVEFKVESVGTWVLIY